MLNLKSRYESVGEKSGNPWIQVPEISFYDLGSVAVIASDSHARGRGFETRLGKCRFSNDGSWKHYLNKTLHLVVSL